MRVSTILIAGLVTAGAASPVLAQGAFVWAKQLTSPASCSGVPESVATDPTGAVVVAGHFCDTTDVDPGPGVHLLTASSRDPYVLKLDSAGSLVWVDQFVGTLASQAFDVALDQAGNVYVTGSFQGTVDFDPGPGTLSMTSAGNLDVFIVKLTSSGVLVWARSLGNSTAQSGDGIAVDPNGNVIVVGDFTGTLDFDPGPGMVPMTSAGGFDAFILKLDSAGNFGFARRFGSTGTERARAVATDGPAPTFVGEFSGTVDFDPSGNTFNLTSFGGSDAYVCRLDGSGGFNWARQLGGTGADAAYDLAIGAFGVVFTVGDYTGTADFDPGPGVFNLTAVDSAAFVSKLDNAGQLSFAKQLGGNTSLGPTARGIAFVNGRIHTVGNFRNTSDFDPGAGTFSLAPSAQGDAYISILEGNGNFHWAGQLSSDVVARAFAVAVSSIDNIYTVGTFQGFTDFDPGGSEFVLDSAGIEDSFVSRLSPAQLGGTAEGLTVRKSGTTDLRLDWGASCTPSMPGFGVYEGTMGSFSSHGPIACFFGTTPTLTFTPQPGSRYYLVVPNDGINVEGSYGRDSAGVERPQGFPGQCAAQAAALGCP